MSPSQWEIGPCGYVRRRLLDLTSRREHREELGRSNIVVGVLPSPLFVYHYPLLFHSHSIMISLQVQSQCIDTILLLLYM
jgi:hypothetical protein